MIRSLRYLREAATPWLRGYSLNRGFWLFFAAALLWDAGFGLYLFLFNLYLLDFHLNERAIGLINGALSLGVVAGTLPAGIWARQIGARRLLLFCFLGAPVAGALRTFFVWEPAAIALAFLAGVVMCVWTVCFLPVTASLTSESNRAAATGLIFSVGVGAAALGAAATGYLSQWVAMLNSGLSPADVKRILLLLSSGVVACGTIPLFRLSEVRTVSSQHAAFRQNFLLLRQSFLRRFLPCLALWSSLIGAFIPFAAVYFTRQRHISLSQVGLIFSASQLAQLIGGLLVPLVARSLGLMRSIVISQLATGILLALTAFSSGPAWCIVSFLGYSAAQWIASPAMYTVLMNKVAETDRSGASALAMFSNFLLAAAATSATGILLSRFGYLAVMLALAALECILAIAFRWLIPETSSPVSLQVPISAESFTD
jgi:MFS family permease